MTRVFTRSLLLGGLALAATSTGCNQQQPQAEHKMTARAAVIANYHQKSPAEVQDFVRAIEPQLNRSKTNVRVVNRPNGSKHILLNGGFQNVLIARTNPDGTMSQACVDSAEQATQFLSKPRPARAKTSAPAVVR
jgi:hypothetical protein